MERHSEAEDRLWESQCCLPTTVRSRSAVSKLRAMTADDQTHCILKYTLRNLPHLLRCALTAGISPDTRWGESNTPVLCIAAELGNERALEALLVGRANVALADSKGRTAAHWAAYKGHAPCLRLLLTRARPGLPRLKKAIRRCIMPRWRATLSAGVLLAAARRGLQP